MIDLRQWRMMDPASSSGKSRALTHLGLRLKQLVRPLAGGSRL